MNINIGDTVYIRCISQPPMDITTIVAKRKKNNFTKKGKHCTEMLSVAILMKTEKQSGSGSKRMDT